jgi:hypothetical protein
MQTKEEIHHRGTEKEEKRGVDKKRKEKEKRKTDLWFSGAAG